MKKLTKKEYEKLVERQYKASKENDYSKMIMMGDENDKAMTKYKQDNLCTHPNIQTIGGQDYCAQCGKTY